MDIGVAGLLAVDETTTCVSQVYWLWGFVKWGKLSWPVVDCSV